MSNNQKAWNQEYQNPNFLSLATEPSKDFLRFVKWIQQNTEYRIQNIEKDFFVLDLGCGNGRHLNFLAEQFGVSGLGVDVSELAIDMARDHADKIGIGPRVKYQAQNMADGMALEDGSVDLVIDSVASNSLYEGERTLYLRQLDRIMKPGSLMYIRALCLDGDRNARNLIKESPGPEKDTYILPEVFVMERVFTEKDFRELYGEYFEILFLKKQTGYQRWGSQSYKRRYIVAYLKKK